MVCLQRGFSSQSGLGFEKALGFLLQISDKENWAALEKGQPEMVKAVIVWQGCDQTGAFRTPVIGFLRLLSYGNITCNLL